MSTETERFLPRISRRVADAVRGDLQHSQLNDLLRPAKHQPIIERRRAIMIHSRVRMVAGSFALLTPLWSIIDILIFEWPLWGWLVGLRLAASAAFALLAIRYRITDSLAGAWRGLALLLAIPVVFFCISHPLLNTGETDDVLGIAGAMAAGYAFLPFVMVAGLSVFPLTAIEGFLFSLPLLAIHMGAGIYGSPIFPFPSYLGAFWLLLLITGVSSLAAMSQLHFMMALVDQATHDPLTGAFSRRVGEELLRLQVANAARAGTPVSLVFLDLDDFKQVNDHFGHDAGDRVLRNAAESIRSQLRPADVFIRWGGEEFLLVLPNTPQNGSMSLIERLRAYGFGDRPDHTPQTASIGVAECLTDHINDWESLVELADHRMYMAKQSGKNRVVGRTRKTQPA